jgi:transcriptional regulator with XRE-family HTH domain
MNMEYHTEIKRLRLKEKLTQTQLASLSDMTSQNLNSIEAGKRFVSTDLFFRIIAAMGYDWKITVKKVKK